MLDRPASGMLFRWTTNQPRGSTHAYNGLPLYPFIVRQDGWFETRTDFRPPPFFETGLWGTGAERERRRERARERQRDKDRDERRQMEQRFYLPEARFQSFRAG